MNKMVFKGLVFSLVAGSFIVVGGCKSKNANSADLFGSDNLYGDQLTGDVMLNDTMGLPTDGDRSMFPAILFAYDSSQVNPEEAGKCEDVAKYTKKNRGGGVIVEGHGDERGSREYNLALGERRALAIRDYLISLGVDPAVIQTKSLGEEMPENMGHDEAAWRLNRRGVFAIY